MQSIAQGKKPCFEFVDPGFARLRSATQGCKNLSEVHGCDGKRWVKVNVGIVSSSVKSQVVLVESNFVGLMMYDTLSQEFPWQNQQQTIPNHQGGVTKTYDVTLFIATNIYNTYTCGSPATTRVW